MLNNITIPWQRSQCRTGSGDVQATADEEGGQGDGHPHLPGRRGRQAGQEPPAALPALRLQDALWRRADGAGAGPDGGDAAGNLAAGPGHDTAGGDLAGMYS